MLDLILVPAALLLALGLRAVRRGDPRIHGHLMAAAFTLVGIRLALPFPYLPHAHRNLGLGLLALAAGTILLGRQALAWREGRSHRAMLPRIHRAAGTFTLAVAALAAVAWLLRRSF
ncbi:MAG TPA: hypothetical protein VF804_06855 [Holophagaceae bacterium]